MGILAAYLYFFEPYGQLFDETIDSIFNKIFPARHMDDGWITKFPNVIYETRRI